MNRKKRETLTPYHRQLLLRGILTLLKSHRGHVRCNMRSFVEELRIKNTGFPFSNQHFVERTLLELHKARAIVLLREQPSNPELRQFAGKIVTSIKLISEAAFALVSDEDLADLRARYGAGKTGKPTAKAEPTAAKPTTAKPVPAPTRPKPAKPAKIAQQPKPAKNKASAEEDRIMRLTLLMDCLYHQLPLDRYFTRVEILDKLGDSARHFTGTALHLDLTALVDMGLVELNATKDGYRYKDTKDSRAPFFEATIVVLQSFDGRNPLPGRSASHAVLAAYREHQIINLVEKWPFGFPCHSALLLPALYQHWGPSVPGNVVRRDITNLVARGVLEKVPCRPGDKKFGFTLQLPKGLAATDTVAQATAEVAAVQPAAVSRKTPPAAVDSTVHRVLLSKAELEAELEKLQALAKQLEDEHNQAIEAEKRRAADEQVRINKDFAARKGQALQRIAAIEKLLPHYEEVAAVIGAPTN